MKRILVTGGAGFLGSHLVDRLLGLDTAAEVVVVDNFSTGAEENVPRRDRLTVFYGDVANAHDLAAAGKVDEIYHLACPASPVHYQADQVTTMETAVMGTRRVLEYARRCRARVFIASTSEVYGDPLVHPQREDYWGNANPYGPRACYSDDTEVLTKRGWVLFQALRKGVDEVATIDPEQRVEFVRPTEIIRQHYRGDLLHFSNLKMDLLVTPNHKMIDERHGRQFVQADAPVEWQHRHAPVPYSDIDFNLRPPVQAHYTAPVRVPYDGEVWCVDAPPHHTLLVRRGGKAIFCGNCYDEGKRAAEALSWCFHKQHGVDVRIARIFNTYGPRMRFDDGRVVSNFVLQALRGEPITIYGDGEQTRSFCYVDDLVRGFTALMALPGGGPTTGLYRVNYPVNLGNPGEFTILELAQMVLAGTGSHSAFEKRPLPPDDPTRRRPDIQRAITLLGWEPRVQLADGLAATIADFRARLAAPAHAAAGTAR